MSELITAYDKLQLDMVGLFQGRKLGKAIDRYIERAKAQTDESPLDFAQTNVRQYESNRPADYLRWAAWIRVERELQAGDPPEP